jgi:hypothetical protein
MAMSATTMGAGVGWNRVIDRRPPMSSLRLASRLPIILGLTVLLLAGCGRNYAPLPRTFEGDSGKLQRTVIVPTLESPIPEGKSAIWCSAFQIAWNHLKTDVAKGPLQVKNAEALAKALNDAPQSEADLPPGAYYATAGLVKDGIVEQIRSEMSRRFPKASFPPFESSPLDVAVAFAYLASGVELTRPLQVNGKPLLFKDSQGHDVPVRSFGLVKEAGNEATRTHLAQQIRFLSHQSASEFVLDLCWDSRPNQVVVARLPRQATLAKMLNRLEDTVKKAPAAELPRLGLKDEVLVPMMHWRIAHDFRELAGPHKQLLNPLLHGTYISRAMEQDRFSS